MKILNFALSIFLFTKSDVPTFLVPIVSLAVLSCPSPRAMGCLIWTYANLLQCCVASQRKPSGIADDALNKPWRPIPAALISHAEATVLRWTLLPICLIISWAYGVAGVGIALSATIILHNELELDSHYLTRAILNAAVYAIFDSGATFIARGQGVLYHNNSYFWLWPQILSALIICTTIHAQDFRDEIGDRSIGRHTIPTEMHETGRMSILIGIILWSLIIAMFFSSSNLASLLLVILGTLVGSRFYLLRTVESDRASYVVYNVGLVAEVVQT
ncbi:hypothetical protein B0H19DRAFT_936851 [Mycena capillaripes]|nr:hypothetical protein B0H19DRAFT_936851 [Mycena capillaripes]